MSIHTDAAFFERDYERDGFEWLDCQNADYAVYAFVRKAKKQEVLVILNFDHTDIYDYKISFPGKKFCHLLLDSNSILWGGTDTNIVRFSLEQGMFQTDIKHFSGQYFLLK